MAKSRDEKVIIRLSPDIKEKFERIANEQGLPMSTYGSVIIGQHVHQHEVMKQKMVEAVKDAVTRALNELFSSEPEKLIELAKAETETRSA